MGLEERELREIEAWSLRAKWTTANAEADAVRTVHRADAESSLFVKSISAESRAENQLRAAQREADQRLDKSEDRSVVLQDLKSKQDQIANDLAAEKEGLKQIETKALTKVEPAARARLYGRLVDPNGGTVCDTSSSRPPKTYYVIVGRGTAAVLDHATLRQTDDGDKRLKDAQGKKLPVLHIGLPDPWFFYHAHGMGQPPYLLTLPGMHFRPTPLDRDIRSGMHSNDFAYKSLQEWSLLKVKYSFEHLEGWVAVIQKKEKAGGDWNPLPEWDELPEVRDKIKKKWKEEAWPNVPNPAPYRLIVVMPDKSLVLIYAAKIDICTGIPRASIENAKPHREALGKPCAEALTRLWEPPDKWSDEVCNRKIVTGPEALCEMTAWYANQRMLVNGGGGIGLNMVERAEDVGCALDWVHYQTLHGTFNLERNDTVMKDPKTSKAMKPGAAGLRSELGAVVTPKDEKDPRYNTIPFHRRWRFARFATVKPQEANKITLSGSKLKVVIEPDPKARILDCFDDDKSAGVALANGAFPFSDKYRDANKDLSPADGVNGLFDRLLCTGGAVNEALGSPHSIADGFDFKAIDDKNGRTVALGAESDAIRILGAAAIQYPKWATIRTKPTQDYFETLPVSAVPPGFIFAGVNIAGANGLFTKDNPNINANTMSQSEIEDYLKAKSVDPTLAGDLAKEVVTKRRPRNGFASAKGIETVLTPVFGTRSGWREAVAKLETDYKEAGKLRD